MQSSIAKILLISVFFSVFCALANIIQPCKINDDACITRSAKIALPQIMTGIPSLGIESTDPSENVTIEGDLSVLKYNFTDSTILGFKNCDIDDVKLRLEASRLQFELTCHDIQMNGNYEITGRLIILPVDGKGKFHIYSKTYFIAVDTEIRLVKGNDGKQHLNIKSFKLSKMEARDGMTFDFENLFNGQKELANTILKFANENWKEVADFVQDPIFNTNFKRIIPIVNKYLKTVPFEYIILQ